MLTNLEFAMDSILWPIITRELQAFGLPEELGYLAWMESGLNPSAKGPVDSVGVWQLVPDTARAYGLRVDRAIDERIDPAKSSRAAAQALAESFAEFGTDATLIAVASYHLGQPKTRELLHEIAMEKGSWRSGQRSYWHLYRMHRLSPEAKSYVPRVVATALVDRSIP